MSIDACPTDKDEPISIEPVGVGAGCGSDADVHSTYPDRGECHRRPRVTGVGAAGPHPWRERLIASIASCFRRAHVGFLVGELFILFTTRSTSRTNQPRS